MFGIGFFEILVILVIALLVFGPDRVPTMIKEAAAFIRDLRAMVAKARNDFGDSVTDLGIDKEDLELLRELRNPKSYLRQQVLNGADLSDLGLDDPELKEATSLNGSHKGSHNGESNGKPKSARPQPHEAESSTQREITDDESVTTTASHHEVVGNDVVDDESAHDRGGSDETTSATAPRFDPDTT